MPALTILPLALLMLGNGPVTDTLLKVILALCWLLLPLVQSITGGDYIPGPVRQLPSIDHYCQLVAKRPLDAPATSLGK